MCRLSNRRLFSVIFLAFELRYKAVARWVESQFGFMFTYTGRLSFLIL